MEDAEVVLSRAPLFQALDEESARALRLQLTDVTLARGDHLFRRAGRRPAVRRARRQDQADPGGAPTAGRTCSACSDRARCSGSCRCSTRGRGPRRESPSPMPRLAGLAHDDLRPWLTERPDVAMHMLRALASGCAGPTTSWPTWSSPTCRAGWPRRCLIWPTGSGSRTGGLEVHHDLTQEELAQLVGASRETVNKALADFSARGWLQSWRFHRNRCRGMSVPLRGTTTAAIA